MIKREGTRYVWGGAGAIGLSMYGIPRCLYASVEKVAADTMLEVQHDLPLNNSGREEVRP
jgi:hypothetical protein